MPAPNREQRRSRRFPCTVPVRVVMGRREWSTSSSDVSRHGMFLRVDDPPRERFLVKLGIELPEGPLEATAFVSRRVAGDAPGVGVQFFALSAQAKGRWDAFVATLSGSREAASPPSTTLPADSSTFLIKLRNVERMLDFFERNVRSGKVIMTTPLLRKEGSAVALIVIHPDSEREFAFHATVSRVHTTPTKSMELELAPLTEKITSRFYDFVATGTPSVTMDLAAQPAEPEPPEAGPDGSLPFAFEVDTETGDLSIDIEVDADASEELDALVDIVPATEPLPVLGAPPEVVAVRCTACGAFLGPADVTLPAPPLGWVATRRVRYDRFSETLTDVVEPIAGPDLEVAAREHEEETIPAAALFELARQWTPGPGASGPDWGPALRAAAASLVSGRDRERADVTCPICGKDSVFVSAD